MSDRAKGIIVTLARDIRVEDDLEPVLTAIRMIKGVAAVDVSIVDGDAIMNRNRIRHEVQMKMYDAIDKVFKEDAT